MILSSADILRILGRNEVIRLSAQVSIVDGKPALSGREGIHIYVNRFPVLEEFEATWQIWIESDEEDDLIIAELKRLLPRVQVSGGLMTTVSTTEFRSDNTQKAPEAPKAIQAQVDMSAIEERFQELAEDIQDRMLLVTSGRPGKDGRDGQDGVPGRDGRDIEATETNLEDLANVDQVIPKQDGQVLTWKNGTWQNLFASEVIPAYGGGGTSPGQQTSLLGNGEWRYNPGTAGDPANGRVQFNDADPSFATETYINRYTSDGKDVYNLLPAVATAGTLLYVQGGPADNYYLYDVTADAVQVGGTHILISVILRSQGVDAGFSNNQTIGLASYSYGGGGGGSVFVIDDLLDVDTSTTAPQAGDILKWDGSRWVPDATTGTGIEEAPTDGNYYVRQNGNWVDLKIALSALGVDVQEPVDAGDFTTGFTSATNDVVYDAGNFTTNTSDATTTDTLEGGSFT